MKTWNVFCKTLLEMSRDKWMLGLTLAFAPFFVLLYWLILSGGSTTYTILMINQDKGVQGSGGSIINAGKEAISAVKKVTYANGQPILTPIVIAGKSEVASILKNRGAVAFIIFPEDFTSTLQSVKSGNRSVTTKITFGGDLSNPYYLVGVNLAITALDSFIQKATGQQPMISYVEEPLGSSTARTEFESYVPGTLVFAVILLIFLASMTVAREIETGTLRRLQLTTMSSFNLLGGVTAALVLVGTFAFALAFIVALVLGFRSHGPIWLIILVGAVTCLSVIGLGMTVASFTRTVSQAFVVANFPMAMMMFFSGTIYPLPKVTLFNVGGQAVGLYDILPPTHAVSALNKILVLGVGPIEITFELSALIVLSLLYFLTGVWLFNRIHLRSQ